jgi:transcriptional regulator with XRE-family HTH domain
MVTQPSAAQVKAARALIGWTQPDLAAASGVSVSTIRDFERSARLTEGPMVEAMAEALHRVGVRFIDNGVQVDRTARVAAGVRALAAKVLG